MGSRSEPTDDWFHKYHRRVGSLRDPTNVRFPIPGPIIHARLAPLPAIRRLAYVSPQTSLAYSVIDRSEENHAIPAVFRMLDFHQLSGWRR